MPQAYRFNLDGCTPQISKPGGYQIGVNADLLPSLHRFSCSLLFLNEKGVREPHWHSNANKLIYCLEGRGAITLLGPSAMHETFSIESGELVFISRSFLHHIENKSTSPLKILQSFDHERPDYNELSSAIQGVPTEILGPLFHQPPAFFNALNKESSPVVISAQERPLDLPYASIPNRYKYNLAGSQPVFQSDGGSVRKVHSGIMPTLNGLSAFMLCLKENGIREPHWHLNAHELNYCMSGQVRIAFQFPGGALESLELGPGEISLLPRGYLHYIQNIGNEEAKLIVFFNHENPNEIGLSSSMGAYSNSLLASLFGVTADYFESFPKFQKDMLIVSGSC